MQGPATDTPTHDLVVIGLHHLAALGFFEETQSLAAPMREINDKLLAAYEARATAERSHAPVQAQLPLADIELDALVMALAEVVKGEAVDGDSTLFEALFPEGLQRVVDPIGVLEAEAVKTLVTTLGEHPDAAPLKEPWLSTLQESLGRYEKAITAREASTKELDAALAAEEKAREGWFALVDEHCTELEQHFPDSPVTEAVFFAP